MIVNELSGSSFVHKMQGLLFKSIGYEKLGQKYLDHYAEEQEWIEKYANRMMDLGCTPEVNVCHKSALIEDPKQYIEADLKLQREGVEAVSADACSGQRPDDLRHHQGLPGRRGRRSVLGRAAARPHRETGLPELASASDVNHNETSINHRCRIVDCSSEHPCGSTKQ